MSRLFGHSGNEEVSGCMDEDTLSAAKKTLVDMINRNKKSDTF